MSCTRDEFDDHYKGEWVGCNALTDIADCRYISTLNHVTLRHVKDSLSDPFTARTTCLSPLCGAVMEDSVVIIRDTDCTVCLASVGVGDACQLPCGHVFHQECVEKWVREKGSCPNCRASTRTANASALGVDQYIRKYVDPLHEWSGDFHGVDYHRVPTLIGGPGVHSSLHRRSRIFPTSDEEYEDEE